MPVSKELTASNDYQLSKDTVNTLGIGQTVFLDIDNYKRVQKYIYEIGLKMKPRREFSTKKISETSLRVSRTI